jgi:hypothetical protein
MIITYGLQKTLVQTHEKCEPAKKESVKKIYIQIMKDTGITEQKNYLHIS